MEPTIQQQVEDWLAARGEECFEIEILQCNIDNIPSEIMGLPFQIIETKIYIDMETLDIECGQYDQRTDWIFSLGDKIYKTRTTYNSWESEEMDAWVEVVQVEKTIKVWEAI